MGSHRYAGPRHAKPQGPRHAKPAPPSAAQRTIAATGVAAAMIAGETLTLAGAAGAVTPDAWAKLRMCESSGNYATNTGNGYYGAYQFNLATWQGLGYTGLPSSAAPTVQDEAALSFTTSAAGSRGRPARSSWGWSTTGRRPATPAARRSPRSRRPLRPPRRRSPPRRPSRPSRPSRRNRRSRPNQPPRRSRSSRSPRRCQSRPRLAARPRGTVTTFRCVTSAPCGRTSRPGRRR